MNISPYESLVSQYEALLSRTDTPIQEKANDLAVFILINVEALSNDLSKNEGHVELYSRIKASFRDKGILDVIKQIQYNADLLTLKAAEKDPDKLALLLNQKQNVVVVDRNTSQAKILEAFDAVRNTMKRSLQLGSDFEYQFSKLIVSFLGLGDKTSSEIGSLFKLKKIEASAVAHFVNANTGSLMELGLSVTELTLLAPYLQFVNCMGIDFKDDDEIQNFIKKCSNASELYINSDKLKGFTDLPATLEVIQCSYCFTLTELALSNLPALKKVSCCGCSALEKIECSNLPSLDQFDCNGNSALRKLALSNFLNLSVINCYNCRALTDLTLSNLPALSELDCTDSTSLQTLELSNFPKLKDLSCSGSTALRELVLSNLPALKKLLCSDCSALETIRAISLPRCRRLDHSDCPRLRQLPQLPNGCFVIAFNSIRFRSFEVDPDDLIKQPLEVLNHLGEFLLQDKRMPNVVYLHSEGLDAGGLRRQLVTTLLKHLFEGDGLPLLTDLNDQKQVFGMRTLGALVALAALGSLPLGRVFKDNFYYALLNLDGTDEKQIYRLLYALPPEDEVTEAEIQKDRAAILAIATAAKGFQEIVGEGDLKRLRELEFKQFVNLVAGEEITWDNFQNKVVYTGDAVKTKEYFQTFFNESPDKLADMIELFTSSRALGEEKIKIIIESDRNKESLMDVTTCFQLVKIPLYETYEKFREKLLKTCEHVLGRFDKA